MLCIFNVTIQPCKLMSHDNHNTFPKMDLINQIAKNLNIPAEKVSSTVSLIKDDNTIPFIARYRKEVTGDLDEVQIRDINDELQRLENLENRRTTILKSIAEDGKLTDQLKQQLLAADTITLLEDLYQPYRPKRRTRATIAKEKGLEILAQEIINQPLTRKGLSEYLAPFLTEKVQDEQEALDGACDIVAEAVSENAIIRQTLRKKIASFGKLISEKRTNADDERQVYKNYYQFERFIRDLQPHQVLAINRGEREKILRINLKMDDILWKSTILIQFPLNNRSIFFNHLLTAIEDSAKRLLLPSMERDIRNDLREKAESHAIKVFADNLRALLTQPPISGHVILGIDPGFRTGCKVAVIDTFGKLLDTATIYPHPPQRELEKSYSVILNLINKYYVTLIVIGNGTASRETEQFIAQVTKENDTLNYLITSEAGASVYSASQTARNEFPDLDVSMRGAVSIARRVQDPLAELVKIDPRSIGVGLYQHDLNQSRLSDTLRDVVESVVNTVGVALNTASAELLAYVSGIGPGLAEKIVDYRQENGRFDNRLELLNVPGLGPKTFEQSSGFLRIRNGNNPLDSTAIHPENYERARKIINELGLSISHLSQGELNKIRNTIKSVDQAKFTKKVGIKPTTLYDIFNELSHPGRDPRDDLPKPLLRNDVLTMADLSPGMQITGTIRNVVDFGSFIDIGVKIDGLLHRSRIPKGLSMKVGDTLDLIILSIDHERNRIALAVKETANK